MSVIVTLKKPIKVGEDELTQLELREPTVKDITEIGYPYRISQSASGAGMEILPAVVIKYVSKLASVPPSALNSLSISDLTNLQTEVMNFFGDAT